MSKEKFFLDATGAVFFARQLEFVKSRSYNVKYPEFAWTKMFPISQEAPLGAKSITYRTYDQAGQAKVFNSMAKDLPRVDVAATETTVPVQTIAASFAYTVMEINQARLTGLPLEAKRAAAARRAIEQKLNSIAFSGDSAANLTGLFSDANVPRGDAPAGAALGTTWATKTAAEILTDVNRGFGEVFEDSKGVHRANKLALNLANWTLLMNTPIGTDYNKTVAQYVVDNSPWLTSLADIMYANELDNAGTSSVDVGVFFSQDPEMLQFELVQDVQFHEAQLHGLEYEIPATAETAGLNIYYPWSIFILEKI
jgi:hypothetical protein